MFTKNQQDSKYLKTLYRHSKDTPVSLDFWVSSDLGNSVRIKIDIKILYINLKIIFVLLILRSSE